jgi:hypothetical protein
VDFQVGLVKVVKRMRCCFSSLGRLDRAKGQMTITQKRHDDDKKLVHLRS